MVLWDVDHKDATDITHPLSISNVGHVLREGVPANRVFALSSEMLNKTPFIFNMPVFNHHLYRQFEDPAAQVTSGLVYAAATGEKFGLKSYVPAETPVKKVTLSNSRERRLVLGAINNIFTTLSAPPQLLTLAVQTADELMMNAVFDAPCRKAADGSLEYYKRKLERSDDFPLVDREQIELELAFCRNYFAIQVRDQFGSLKTDAVLQYIRRDYETTAYKAREGDPGAGLGVYGILQSGLSLLFSTKELDKTEVTVFVPIVKSMKTFRKSFRFFGFL